MVRCVGGRPGRRRERLAQRRRNRSRCQRNTVPGVTIRRTRGRRPCGSNPSSNTSHARSAQVSLRARRGSRRCARSKLMTQHTNLDVLRRRIPPGQPQPGEQTGSRPDRSASTPRHGIIPARSNCRHPQDSVAGRDLNAVTCAFTKCRKRLNRGNPCRSGGRGSRRATESLRWPNESKRFFVAPALIATTTKSIRGGFSVWAGALHRSVLRPLEDLGIPWSGFDG